MNLNLLSQRLRLTPYTPEDLDLSIALFTDPEVVRYAGGVMSDLEIRGNMSKWCRRGGDGCIGIWTVSNRTTAEKYGSVALLPMPIEDQKTDYDLVVPGEMPEGIIEIGYFLKRSAWGYGYATEACQRLLEFAFQESPLQEIFATFDENNRASGNVLEKVGFSHRGTMRCYGQQGLCYRITRDEWLRMQSD